MSVLEITVTLHGGSIINYFYLLWATVTLPACVCALVCEFVCVYLCVCVSDKAFQSLFC